MKKPRILLADDHRMVADGLRSLLEPEFEVVAIVGDGHELVAAGKRLRPDLIVADVTMPSLNGIEAAVQLREAGIEAKVVFLTMHHDAAYAGRALECGASGYVLKHSAPAELVLAVREALLGRIYVTPAVAAELIQTYGARPSDNGYVAHALTARQLEVLQLVAEGRSAKEVAGVLSISPRTAQFHKARILEVLRLHTTAELIQYAIRRGLISA